MPAVLQLWSLLMPETALENRITSQWGEIGFQGKNPETDFRGMGMSHYSVFCLGLSLFLQTKTRSRL